MNNKTTLSITRNELIEKLRSARGALPISISAFTDTKAKKTDNPYGPILKLNRINGIIGFDYTKSVNNQLFREQSDSNYKFVGKHRSWGVHETAALIKYKNEYFLQIMIRRALGSPLLYYKDANGFLKSIDKWKVEHLLPSETRRLEQASVAQNLVKPVTIRDYALRNIKSIHIGGERYIISDNPISSTLSHYPVAN